MISLLGKEIVYAGVGWGRVGGRHKNRKGAVHKYSLRVPLVMMREGVIAKKMRPHAESRCESRWVETQWLLEGSTFNLRLFWVHMLDNCYNTLASSMASIHLYNRGEGTRRCHSSGTLVREPRSDQKPDIGDHVIFIFISLAFSKRSGTRCKGFLNGSMPVWMNHDNL